MQVRITPDNQKLLSEYREKCKKVIATYSVGDKELVNLLIAEKLNEEIRRMKGKGV